MLTVDYFTPIVDDPRAFGQIAAANALSDVYAMGGRPVAMLSIVGFPRDKLPMTVLGEILRGGAEKAKEAGVSVVGGHSIDDAEPKVGLRRRRPGQSRADLAERRRAARGRPRADEAARDRDHLDGDQAGEGAGAGGDGGRRARWPA